MIISFFKRQKLIRRTKLALGANEAKSSSKIKGGKHIGLSNRQRRKLSVERARKEERRNPFTWCA